MWNRDLAASESQLLQIQNDIQKRKEICSEIFSQEIELKREIEEIDFSNDSRLVSNRSSVRMQGNNDPNPIHDDSRGDFDSFSEDDQH